MPKSHDPNDERESPPGAKADPAADDPQIRFASSRPPRTDVEWSLLTCLRRLANCYHPKEARSSAVILEDDGSRLSMAWCGACGAVRMPDEQASEWTRPGIAQVLADCGLPSKLASNLRGLAQASATLTKAAGALSIDLDERPGDPSAELSARVLILENACVELERAARQVLERAGS